MTDKSHSSDTNPRYSRPYSFAMIGLAYLCALFAAGVTVVLLPDLDPLWQAAWADVVATLVIFVFGWRFKNSSFYDAYWSVAPPLLILFWLATASFFDLRAALVLAIVAFWSVGLTHNWARGWSGLAHQDWRYVDLKESTGALYPLVDLLGIQMMPTILVFLGTMPVWFLVFQGGAPLGALDIIWPVLGFAAVLLERVADNELRAFRLGLPGTSSKRVLATGVWAYVRHPNYLGEIGFWLSLGLAGFAASGQWLSLLGFALILGLFVGITVPMIERRQLAAKPEYAAYCAEVGALLPRLRRRTKA